MNITGRRQLYSSNKIWFFPADTKLYTTEMPSMPGIDYKYETCVFFNDYDSNVIDRYSTIEEAREGHIKYTQAFDLKFIEERFICNL